ncbi:MAG TPA: bifunctional diaminohydroxyphosphoribosylaminopyrimidine deaminase/5-amino-6-(5-phosphoribosylamino)uracil reductase RibD [Chitinophagales bacterium]|nr:bifunctional diaminohydroxyphosphoribosylaminopyrimidine deaminase/5-amino-6-(5-phosphoribosylamino)uracil reductase RibD [Chitinophagales bacterium]HPR30223.1 bifunctional diaminohydroxyphosphoribosylaminopyrimidine deaminase/5-amino-6-(5-phosphoribosylamino)uracil reductase RibD [Chitinophagales bacterium]
MSSPIGHMTRALELAAKGRGFVAPNPMVGAVIVADGKVIGEGYHHRFGEPHAEIEALNSVLPHDQEKIIGATMYVTLEPCSHHGKTPPCADRLIAEQIGKVVIATLDPNPLVAGRGAERLREAGIEVETGMLEQEAVALNKAFFSFHRKGRPFITLKWAQSADGFISALHRQPVHLTNETSDKLVHQLRAEHQSILIGAATAISDDPLLTVRHVYGNDPLRLVLGDDRMLPPELRMLNDGGNTVMLHMEGRTFRSFLLEKMQGLHVISLLVEGGTNTLEMFLQEGLWDDIWRFSVAQTLEGGTPAPRISLVPDEKRSVDGDVLEIYHRQ